MGAKIVDEHRQPAAIDDNEMLAAILESASQAILVVNRQGQIVRVNAKSAEMFGYTREELADCTVERLLPDALRDKHVNHRLGYFASPRVRPMGAGYDLSAKRKDGSVFPVEISLSHIGSGGDVYAIAFVSDITARKKMEDNLLQSQKLEAVGRLAGGIAHDFNNLLTVILGYNRFLLDHFSPIDPLRGYSEEIGKAAERAAALTKQLLAFSRQQPTEPQILNLSAVVMNLANMLRRLLGETITLDTHLAADIGEIKADRSQLEQVLMNLVVNAKDALPNGGRITIETANVKLDSDYQRVHQGVQTGSFVMLAVTDTGVGMDAQTRQRVFEPFFTTKPVDKGTGLGLATVYGIVKQHGGDIWVYSEKDQGTTFKVYFPIASGVPLPERSPRPAAKVQGGSETLLLVEDEEGVRKLLSTVLRQNGYNVLVANNGRDALDVSKGFPGPIDVLITDVVMPEMTGRDLVQHISVSRPQMKVVYMSGYTETTIAQQGILSSDVPFLSKPIVFETLLGKIREVVSMNS